MCTDERRDGRVGKLPPLLRTCRRKAAQIRSLQSRDFKQFLATVNYTTVILHADWKQLRAQGSSDSTNARSTKRIANSFPTFHLLNTHFHFLQEPIG